MLKLSFTTHFKVVVCDHYLNEFCGVLNKNKLEENLNFESNCTNTYGSHRLFTLICTQCRDRECVCKADDSHCCVLCVLNFLNHKLPKSCFLHEDYIDAMFFFLMVVHLIEYLNYFNTEFKFFYSACRKKIVATSI